MAGVLLKQPRSKGDERLTVGSVPQGIRLETVAASTIFSKATLSVWPPASERMCTRRRARPRWRRSAIPPIKGTELSRVLRGLLGSAQRVALYPFEEGGSGESGLLSLANPESHHNAAMARN